ncbi:MAG: NYN domain-containing protein [Planctomycetes bacterium]|nr:NYN domain-containing protein [Planctomycetota bacterium]
MRVVLFFDGKNFYAGWKDQTAGRDIDFRKLSQWIVKSVGGDHLWGAYYYTGVEADLAQRSPSQDKLDNFLEMLTLQPGFFVQRFPQKMRTTTCPQCGAQNRFSQEKEVDTTMTADMLRLAAVNAFDMAVLISGDADLVPAVEGVRALGKQVYVASWGSSGLSARIRRAAFDHINLAEGLEQFARAPGESWDAHHAVTTTGEPITLPAGAEAETILTACVEEIRRAQAAMPGGYVGVHFFVTRWRSERLAEIPDLRRRALDRLVEQNRIEIYLTADGIQAVRIKEPVPVTP